MMLSEAIFANHLFLQSLLVLSGTCWAIACHFEGFGLPGSSVQSSGVRVNVIDEFEYFAFCYCFTEKLVLLYRPCSARPRHGEKKKSEQ